MISSVNARLARFAYDERGAMTVLWLFGVMFLCLLAGLAIDVTNVHRHKQRLTLAADAAAMAGVIALSEARSASDVQAAALASVETNAPKSIMGTTSGPGDIQLVRFDPRTKRLVSGTPNAVKVTLHRDKSVLNPVRTSFLRLVGLETFDVAVTSVAYYGAPGNCTSSDMLYGKGQVTLTSSNYIGPNFCIHSQTGVWLPQQNFFEAGSGVSMPSLAACKGKCVNAANPGIEEAVFAMNLNLTRLSDHITKVRSAMLAPSSDLKTEFFKDKVLASDLSPLVTAKITTTAGTKKLVKGSVVDVTPAQYNDLMIATNGKLPTGLVYNVDCRDKGNGPTTSISIGAGKDRKNNTLTSATIETVSQVALITDCGFEVGAQARIDAALAISTRISSSSVISAAEGAVIGDPLKNCDLSRKVYLMTMSGVSVNADFTASNIAIMANGNINVAANSSSSAVTHKGTSLHAEGSVQIPANNTFNSCAEDPSGLIPQVRTFKFVAPKA